MANLTAFDVACLLLVAIRETYVRKNKPARVARFTLIDDKFGARCTDTPAHNGIEDITCNGSGGGGGAGGEASGGAGGGEEVGESGQAKEEAVVKAVSTRRDANAAETPARERPISRIGLTFNERRQTF